MMTVKEIAKISGVSTRTLHYYDEIGLLKPSCKSEVGYRFYDDKALERLHLILYFREFDISLKQIREILDNPVLDKNQILQMQRTMLVTKKQRLERLISSMDDILKGENRMDFTVFNEDEIRSMYNAIISNATEENKKVFIEYYGSLEAFEKQFMEGAVSEEAQKNYAKLIELYGSKEAVLKAGTNSGNQEAVVPYQKQLENIQKKIADKTGEDIHSSEIRQLMKEYDFIAKQLYQMGDVKMLLLEIAKAYKENIEIRQSIDSEYGEGSAKYIGEAIEAFYNSHGGWCD
ncbi:MAG: MerR family transcriptional regulator [Lachnospiraceae bacterium]|nr:MerR family transcriptional regulator [Lachnospiraceae bacterium]